MLLAGSLGSAWWAWRPSRGPSGRRVVGGANRSEVVASLDVVQECIKKINCYIEHYGVEYMTFNSIKYALQVFGQADKEIKDESVDVWEKYEKCSKSKTSRPSSSIN